MNIERGEILSELILADLASNTTRLVKAGEYRKSLVSTVDPNWSTVLAVEEIDRMIGEFRRELAESVSFAREFGMDDYRLTKAVLEALPIEQRSACLANMLKDLSLTPGEKNRLLTNEELNPQENSNFYFSLLTSLP